MQNQLAMNEPITPLRSSARIQGRIIKAMELARARARENLLNPPKPTIRKKNRKRKNCSRRSSDGGAPPKKKQKITPGGQWGTKCTKAVQVPEVAVEDPIQEGTVNQGLGPLDSGMSAFDMQDMKNVLATTPQRDAPSFHNQQEPYGQQWIDFQNWGSPAPAAGLGQSWMQSGLFYHDPDDYYWLA